MNYIKLKDEIVLLDNILHVEMKENTIEILYGIIVPEQGNKFYGHVLDYSEVKNDVNEEKTKIEQDYESLLFMLKADDFKIHSEEDFQELMSEKNKIESIKLVYEMDYKKYLNLYEKYYTISNDVKRIINGKGLNKIGRIKKVFKENGF